MARDNQRKKVYTWENTIFADAWKGPHLTQSEVVDLYNRILRDAGHPNPVKITFNKRKGGACANRRSASFTPTRLPLIIVLHEAAHTLTYHSPDTKIGCAEGHGPNYLACYLALVEQYSDIDLEEAFRTLVRGFEAPEKVWKLTGNTVPVTVLSYHIGGGVSSRVEQRPERVIEIVKKKKTPPRFNAGALSHWRWKLAGGK